MNSLGLCLEIRGLASLFCFQDLVHCSIIFSNDFPMLMITLFKLNREKLLEVRNQVVSWQQPDLLECQIWISCQWAYFWMVWNRAPRLESANGFHLSVICQIVAHFILATFLRIIQLLIPTFLGIICSFFPQVAFPSLTEFSQAAPAAPSACCCTSFEVLTPWFLRGASNQSFLGNYNQQILCVSCSVLFQSLAWQFWYLHSPMSCSRSSRFIEINLSLICHPYSLWWAS